MQGPARGALYSTPPHPAGRCGAGIFRRAPGKFGALHALECTLGMLEVQIFVVVVVIVLTVIRCLFSKVP